LILLAPGSLYTSTIPNLLIPEIRDAISRSGAPVIYVANLMTEPGESAGLDLEAHLASIQAFGGVSLSAVIANTAILQPEVARRYAEEGGEAILDARDRILGIP